MPSCLNEFQISIQRIIYKEKNQQKENSVLIQRFLSNKPPHFSVTKKNTSIHASCCYHSQSQTNYPELKVENESGTNIKLFLNI